MPYKGYRRVVASPKPVTIVEHREIKKLIDMEIYVRDKHFPSGSMGPKVQAILEFFQTTRKRGIICHLKDIQKAIAGDAGTEII